MNDTGGDFKSWYSINAMDETFTLTFDPVYNPAYVIVHYQVNNGPQMNVFMTADEYGRYNITITGYNADSKIQYHFTYEKNGCQYDTSLQHYPEIIYYNASSPMYTGNNTEVISFYMMNGAVADYVIIHYQVDNGPVLNEHMTKHSGVWFEKVINVTESDAHVYYYFTYCINGRQYDTQTERSVIHDYEAPSVPQNVYVGSYYAYYYYYGMATFWVLCWDQSTDNENDWSHSVYYNIYINGQFATRSYSNYWMGYNFIYFGSEADVTITAVDLAGNESAPSEVLHIIAN
jgi:hypothetical protein